MNTDPARIPLSVQTVLTGADSILLMSVVSIWELQIKITLGKFSLTPSLAEVVEDARTKDGIRLVGLETAHVYALDALPMLHKDPFDRVIIATAIVEGATILSADGAVAAYTPAVPVLW